MQENLAYQLAIKQRFIEYINGSAVEGIGNTVFRTGKPQKASINPS
ncbi:hypothetical protein CJ739_1784 [Mariniflexile rhizosphaerae]|nr:hypothetical protein [Mariniflexile sp. TRM1-10]AXP80870.1 hypothetical protein CJ739_1784 [Mariniflexile sp. TRM1-10]